MKIPFSSSTPCRTPSSASTTSEQAEEGDRRCRRETLRSFGIDGPSLERMVRGPSSSSRITTAGPASWRNHPFLSNDTSHMTTLEILQSAIDIVDSHLNLLETEETPNQDLFDPGHQQVTNQGEVRGARHDSRLDETSTVTVIDDTLSFEQDNPSDIADGTNDRDHD